MSLWAVVSMDRGICAVIMHTNLREPKPHSVSSVMNSVCIWICFSVINHSFSSAFYLHYLWMQNSSIKSGKTVWEAWIKIFNIWDSLWVAKNTVINLNFAVQIETVIGAARHSRMNDDESTVSDVRCIGLNSCEALILPFFCFHRTPIHTCN